MSISMNSLVKYIIFQIKCSVSADDIDGAASCKHDERLTWDLDETKCGIVIEGASRWELFTILFYTLINRIQFVTSECFKDDYCTNISFKKLRQKYLFIFI